MVAMSYRERRTHDRAYAQVGELQPLAQRYGYAVAYKPTRRVRGWPTSSTRPFLLYLLTAEHGPKGHSTGVGYIASFSSFVALERNLRARAGL